MDITFSEFKMNIIIQIDLFESILLICIRFFVYSNRSIPTKYNKWSFSQKLEVKIKIA